MSSETFQTPAVGAMADADAAAWRLPLLLLGLSLAVLLYLYQSTVASMVAIWWRSETFAHGFLILPISLYLVWTKRQALERMRPRPSWLGVAALLLGAAGWLLAHLVDVQVVEQLALVGMVIALVWAMLGWPVVWAIFFPLAYLFFMVPIGEFLIPPMMEFTASFAVRMIQLTGIPVYWEGFFISLPSGDWSIVEGCSGVRYLIASLAVGALYAYMFYYSGWRRAAFVLLAIVAPIIANGLRAYMIIMIGHLSDMKLATGVDHLIYGWVFFGLVIMLMFWIGSWWWDKAPPAAVERPAVPVASGGWWWATPLVLAVLFAAPLLAAGSKGGDGGDPSLRAPAAVGGWSRVDSSLSSWRPRYLGPSAKLYASYQKDGQQVDLGLYYYAKQTQGAELVNSQNLLIEQKHPIWHLRQSNPIAASVDGRPLTLDESVMRSRQLSMLVWEWYWIDGRVTANDYLAKLLEAWMRLTGGPRGGFGIVLSTRLETDPGESHRVLQRFVDDMSASLTDALQGVD